MDALRCTSHHPARGASTRVAVTVTDVVGDHCGMAAPALKSSDPCVIGFLSVDERIQGLLGGCIPQGW